MARPYRTRQGGARRASCAVSLLCILPALCGCGESDRTETPTTTASSGQGGSGGHGGGGGGGPAAPAGLGLPSGDLTGDGVDDLAVLLGTAEASLLVFAGGSGFSPATPADAALRILPPSGCTLRGPWLLVDANDDGATDVLAGVACDQQLEVVLLEGPLPLGDQPLDSFPVRLALAVDGALPTQLGVAELTGDQAVDLIATYPDNSAGTSAVPGMVQVISDLHSLSSGGSVAPFATLVGTADGDRFGNRIDTVSGDLTGDGSHDLLVGAHHADGPGDNAGAAYLFAGPLSSGTHQAAASYASFQAHNAGSLMGVGIAVGDVDLDGRMDALIGADEDNAAAAYAGRVGVFRGAVTAGATDMNGAQKFVVGLWQEELGSHISTHGDVNGDGDRDVLIWGCCAPHAGDSGVGILVGVFANSGFAGVSSALADFAIYGDAPSDHFGDVRIPGDLNADGADDFAVGLGAANGDQGRVVVVFGGPAIGSGRASDVADVLIEGAPGSSDRFGAAVLSR